MIDLKIKKHKLELLDCSDDATLADLADTIELFIADKKAGEVCCKCCGECCCRAPVLGLDMIIAARREGMSVREWAEKRLLPPVFPDLAARIKLIAEFIQQTGLPELEATVLYEYNQSEPLSFLQTEAERCAYQKNNLCSIYADRPFVCRLYLCAFGERLQSLEEMIVAQGTWHAWSLLGGVPEEMIAHNPFLKAETYSDLLIRDFEFKFDEALEELFSFF